MENSHIYLGLISALLLITGLLGLIYNGLPYKSKLIIKPYERYNSINYNIKYCLYKVFPMRYKYLKYFYSYDSESYYKNFQSYDSVVNFINKEMICTTDLLNYLRKYNKDVKKYKDRLRSTVINL